MKQAGQVVLFRFPQTDLAEGKLRPALMLGRLPGHHDDWLICMISSQIRQHVPDFDEVINEEDRDFQETGLKVSSVVRVGRFSNSHFENRNRRNRGGAEHERWGERGAAFADWGG